MNLIEETWVNEEASKVRHSIKEFVSNLNSREEILLQHLINEVRARAFEETVSLIKDSILYTEVKRFSKLTDFKLFTFILPNSIISTLFLTYVSVLEFLK